MFPLGVIRYKGACGQCTSGDEEDDCDGQVGHGELFDLLMFKWYLDLGRNDGDQTDGEQEPLILEEEYNGIQDFAFATFWWRWLLLFGKLTRHMDISGACLPNQEWAWKSL